jgi:hypothetical protein
MVTESGKRVTSSPPKVLMKSNDIVVVLVMFCQRECFEGRLRSSINFLSSVACCNIRNLPFLPKQWHVYFRLPPSFT